MKVNAYPLDSTAFAAYSTCKNPLSGIRSDVRQQKQNLKDSSVRRIAGSVQIILKYEHRTISFSEKNR